MVREQLVVHYWIPEYALIYHWADHYHQNCCIQKNLRLFNFFYFYKNKIYFHVNTSFVLIKSTVIKMDIDESNPDDFPDVNRAAEKSFFLRMANGVNFLHIFKRLEL